MTKRILSGLICAAILFSVLCLLGTAAENNLSTGKSYTVEYDSKIDNAYPERAYKAEKALTDGKLASRASYSDPAFLKLYRGTTVYVTIDLGEECSVSSVEIRSLQMKTAGVTCPRYAHVAVSTDGENFGTVGSLYDDKSITSATAQIISHKVTLDDTYIARYVRVAFSCDVYVYCDEISVFGNKGTSGAKTAPTDETAKDVGFSGGIDGVENIVLMYTAGNYTAEKLKPYFAYVDSKGNATDVMFESMLFLPSGASGFDFSTKKGWDSYTDNLFGVKDTINLAALNKLVGDLRDELNLAADYRYPVFLSVPYLEVGNTAIDGIVPNSMNNRLTFLSKYIDNLIQRFASAGFDNLEFKGVYWHHELVNYTASNHETELIQKFNQYVHSKDLKSIWIPYYCAPGFETAVDLGFDAATLQSGYAFPRSGDSLNEIGQVQPGAVEDSAAQAKKYGLGMEFELSIGATDPFNRFYKYLHTGYSSGCMNGGMMMLYQSVSELYTCAKSSSGSELRQIYDLLYLYTHDAFTSNAPVVEVEDKVYVIKTDSRFSSFISVTDEDSVRSSWKVVNKEATEGLTYVLEGEGFFLVNTKGTAPGEYSVTFSISDGYNTSEASTLHFLVIDKELPEVELTLEKDLTVYAKKDQTATSQLIPTATKITYIDLGDGWFYVTAKVDGEDVKAFAYQLISSANEESQPAGTQDSTSDGTTLVIVIIAIVAVIAATVAFLLIFKKKKQKTK